MRKKTKTHLFTAYGQRVRYWTDPDRKGIHLTILWKKKPTLRDAGLGFLAAHELMAVLCAASHIALEVRMDPSTLRPGPDNGRNDIRLVLRFHGDD